MTAQLPVFIIDPNRRNKPKGRRGGFSNKRGSSPSDDAAVTAVIQWLLQHTHWIGPVALLAFGWLVKYLQNRDQRIRCDNFFMGTELSLTALGSLLGALVSASSQWDSGRVTVAAIIAASGVGVLIIVIVLHRIFDDAERWPNLRVVMLAGLANTLPFGVLVASLYFIKTELAVKVGA